MASVQSIALTAACLTAGMRDFCSWNSQGMQYDGTDAEHSLLVIWGQGCLELHAELVQYAPMVAALVDTLYDQLDQAAPGIWHYEVTEALGGAIAEWIALHDGWAPSLDWVKTCLVRLAGEFMLRGQPQQWPTIRQILLTLSPELPVIVPVAPA
ncbi:hypothetical protein NH8B_2803 [Pseudogulbenkiania sp. NH8B]|uniref:hypothetical protein n=1 Tax=Pseudogulbenkiania sp. (strain NH8B) TaxID=748280 RepID=UPI0002279C55|nr:hypothetical protein [Pseudogulbenkiania sp. NH8B]BAK77596.1 hypothetical protein NH8B_2803 [Pseudogulbenkiania sp. NH8B]